MIVNNLKSAYFVDYSSATYFHIAIIDHFIRYIFLALT